MFFCEPILIIRIIIKNITFTRSPKQLLEYTPRLSEGAEKVGWIAYDPTKAV